MKNTLFMSTDFNITDHNDQWENNSEDLSEKPMDNQEDFNKSIDLSKEHKELSQKYHTLLENFNKTNKELEEIKSKNQQILRTAAHVQTLYNELQEKMPKEILKSQLKIKNDFSHTLIKIIDMFELALKGMNKDKDNESLKSIISGIQMIYNYMLTNLNEDLQLKKISCKIGDIFDYNIHEAQKQIPTDKENLNNTIAAIVAEGYENEKEILRNPLVDVYTYKEHND